MDKQNPGNKPSSKPLGNKPAASGSTAAVRPAKPAGNSASSAARRGFFVKLAAILIGGFVTLFPFAAGLAVFLDPLGRPGSKTKRVKVTTLDSLEDDGKPHAFPIVTDRRDAWNHYAEEPVGSVYLIRQPGQSTVKAFNATCPHAGCRVDFDEDSQTFLCPCHASEFSLDGKKTSEDGASPRDMDSLTCTVKDGNVTVDFKNFRIGIAQKIKKA